MIEDPALDMAAVKRAVARVKRVLPKDSKMVGCCHNDLLPGNVMLNEESGHVAIVDLEYSLPNFGAFDLANHFMRYCGGSDDPSGKPNYSRFPNRQAQSAFCRTYLEARDQRKPTAAELDKLLDDLDVLSATTLSLVAAQVSTDWFGLPRLGPCAVLVLHGRWETRHAPHVQCLIPSLLCLMQEVVRCFVCPGSPLTLSFGARGPFAKP